MIRCFNTFSNLRRQFPLYSRLVATLVLLFVALLLSGPLTGTGSAQEGATVRLVPTQEGENTIAVAIRIENVTRLYGAEVHLTFDPARLQVQDADPDQEGVQIQAGDFPSPDFVVQNQADNAEGTVDYAATQLAPREPVDGSGVLATITVNGKPEDISALTFAEVKLANPDGQQIPSQTAYGQVEVAATPTAAAGGVRSGLLIGVGVVVVLVVVVVAFLVLKKGK